MWRLVVCQPGKRLPLVSIVWSSHLNHPLFYNLYIYIFFIIYIYIYTNFLKQGFFFSLFIYFLIVVILIRKNWRDEILFFYCEVYFGCINMGTHWPSSVWASSCLAFLEREKKSQAKSYIQLWSLIISEADHLLHWFLKTYIYTHMYIYIYASALFLLGFSHGSQLNMLTYWDHLLILQHH